jgi:hypothetical protein
MLMIRAQQMQVFEQEAWRQFEDEMVVHSRIFSPRHCDGIGDAQLHAIVRSAIVRAGNYNFTCRGPIRLFIEMMFLLGSSFDTDPQYPDFGRILRGSGGEMYRAEQMHEAFLEFHEKVQGAGGEISTEAHSKLSAFIRRPVSYSRNELVAGLLEELTGIYPQKASYTGETELVALIREGIGEANRYGFSTVHAQSLMVALLFALGHECHRDPIYPWIAEVLEDKGADLESRVQRLENQVVTWLDSSMVRRKLRER